MDIRELQRNWDEFGKVDPFWAILTDSDKKDGKWNINDFFETGVKLINDVLNQIVSMGIKVPKGKALDFGCGVGRLTQALAGHFDRVCGVDIAPSMIALAKEYNRYGDKCNYYLNSADNLKLFPDNSFDFIVSFITLQHMQSMYSKNYIKEFLRVLALHGLLIFQLPSELRNTIPNNKENLRQKIKRLMPTSLLNLRHRSKNGKQLQQPVMEMYCIKRDDIVEFLEGNGAKILHIKQFQNPRGKYISYLYYITKE